MVRDLFCQKDFPPQVFSTGVWVVEKASYEIMDFETYQLNMSALTLFSVFILGDFKY